MNGQEPAFFYSGSNSGLETIFEDGVHDVKFMNGLLTDKHWCVGFYEAAKRLLIQNGFESEISWQSGLDPRKVSESEFLREAAWVIFCSGFKETTVRGVFDHLSLCYCDWSSAEEIVKNSTLCYGSAMRVFANRAKNAAVISVAAATSTSGFRRLKARFLRDPLGTFQTLPFLGPVTSIHLAKNLGFDVAKPDRHLVRLGGVLGFTSVSEMCGFLSSASGDSIRVVDVVLWRFLERVASRDSPFIGHFSSIQALIGRSPTLGFA